MKLLTMAMFVLIVNVIGTFGDQCTTNCVIQAMSCMRNCSGLEHLRKMACYNRCKVNLIICNAVCSNQS